MSAKAGFSEPQGNCWLQVVTLMPELSWTIAMPSTTTPAANIKKPTSQTTRTQRIDLLAAAGTRDVMNLVSTSERYRGNV